MAGDGLGRNRGWGVNEIVADGSDALGERGRPGEARDAGGLEFLFLRFHIQAGLSGGGALEFGAEPPHQPGAFVGGAGGVQFDEAEENVFGGEIRLPAVGFGHGAIEVVMDIPEHRDKALIVDHLAGSIERLARAEFGEDVVHFGEGQVGVSFLLTFAVSIELFAEEPNAFALGLGGIGKGEGLEAARFVIPGAVFERSAGGERPCDMNPAG